MNLTRHNISRRDALGVFAAALLPGTFDQEAEQERADSAVAPAPLQSPGLVGRPRSRVTDYENDAFIVGIEEKLRCTCGCNLSVHTCRTTDFTCTVSPAMHQQVISLVEQDKTAEEILEAFVLANGEIVLMAPPKRGFNIVGYVLPGIAISLVGAALVVGLSRRSRRLAAVGAPAEADAVALDPADAERLEAELNQLER